MTIDELRDKLCEYEKTLSNTEKKHLDEYIKKQPGVFPFNEWEYRLMFLRDSEKISLKEYEDIRTHYVDENKYLNLYGLAPRIFGEIWGQDHIKSIDDRFKTASKGSDQQFDGEYDLILNGIKIEVKAARAIDTKKRGELVTKALKRKSNRPFWMNFQQLKPDMCDVFLFIGVWVDEINYWVITPKEAKENPYFSPQHRGGIEYQIGIKDSNITEFDKFKVKPDELVDYISRKINT